MRRLALLSALPLLSASAFAQYPGAQTPPEDLRKGYDAIRIDDAKKILTFLATKCEGRGTGQPGFDKAAQFVADQFKRLHLKPLGDNGTYFQTADFTRVRYELNQITVDAVSGPVKFGPKDATLQGAPAEINASATPVFIEYKGAQTSLRDGVDVKDKIVFIHGDVPNRRIAGQCVLQGSALAALNIVDKLPEPIWQPRMGMQPVAPAFGITGFITPKAAAAIEKECHVTPAQPQAADSLVTTSGDVKIHIEGTRNVQQVKVGNVVGLLEGSDPTLKEQYIGVGGHLDHLGIRAGGVVYPGADDDGSGSTAVMEIAKAMVENPKKPRRSIVFMTFFGEEMGLLGSRYLTDHPPVPLDHMVAELQMDMVGRDSDGVQNGDSSRVDKASENIDTIRLVGSKRISTQLDQVIQDMNKYIGFKFKYDAEDVYTRSDHYNFAAKGIPIAFLFDGFHPDYHQPTDTVDKIDWVKLTSSAKLYYLTAHAVADADEPPKKDVPQRGG